MPSSPSPSRPAGFSAHIGYLFTEYPLEERPAAARRAGFAAVEHPNPRALDAAVLRALLIENGLPFAQIGIAAGDPAQGEKGLAALPEAVARFRDAVLRDLDYAVAIDCPFVQALAGIAPPDVAFARLWATYVENIAFAADAAAERGLGLLIEPICRQAVAGYVMSEAALGVRAILEANRPNIRLLFDSYHAANEGLDSPAFIRRHGAMIAHMHVADDPGRHEPGTGTIDFPAIYAALDAIGFRGFIGCEYVPRNSTENGLAWLKEHAGHLARPAVATPS